VVVAGFATEPIIPPTAGHTIDQVGAGERVVALCAGNIESLGQQFGVAQRAAVIELNTRKRRCRQSVLGVEAGEEQHIGGRRAHVQRQFA
jgi:hypothetical protein